MTRLTDYAILLMTTFAREPRRLARSARELAADVRLPRPTVSKILKLLAQEGLLEAHRGVKGGFRLSLEPERITVADILTALEGPMALTRCCASERCSLERRCIVRSNWRRINRVIVEALSRITLLEMAYPLRPQAIGEGRVRVPRVGSEGWETS